MTSRILCDANVPLKLKGKFYRTAVRSTLLYKTKCWTVKNRQENKVSVPKMRMLLQMCGKHDKIKNKNIRESIAVTPIIQKMMENRLRRFGHVKRKSVDSLIRIVDKMERSQTT